MSPEMKSHTVIDIDSVAWLKSSGPHCNIVL